MKVVMSSKEPEVLVLVREFRAAPKGGVSARV